uniref:Kelch repeat containing protein n=1 Tax=Rhipicephalus appendiculatus TaxID=34631 RepID=A0A131YK73_RHIAP
MEPEEPMLKKDKVSEEVTDVQGKQGVEAVPSKALHESEVHAIIPTEGKPPEEKETDAVSPLLEAVPPLLKKQQALAPAVTKHETGKEAEAIVPVPEIQLKETTGQTKSLSEDKKADVKELQSTPEALPEVPESESMSVPSKTVESEAKARVPPAHEPQAAATRDEVSAEGGIQEGVAVPKLEERKLPGEPGEEMFKLNVKIKISPASPSESEKKDENEKPTIAAAGETEEHAKKEVEGAETTQGKTEAPETPEVVLDEEKRVREILEFEVNLCRARNLGSALPKAEELLHVGTPASEPADSAEPVQEKLAKPPGAVVAPAESPKADTMAPSTLEGGQADAEPGEPILDASDFNKGPMSDWETELQQLRDSRLRDTPYRAGEQGKAAPVDAAVGARKFLGQEGEGKKVPEEKQVTIPPEAEGASPGPSAPPLMGADRRESVVIVYERDALGMTTPDFEIRLKNEREIRVKRPEPSGVQPLEGPPRSFLRPDTAGSYPRSPVIHHVSFTREDTLLPHEKPGPVEEKEVKHSVLPVGVDIAQRAATEYQSPEVKPVTSKSEEEPAFGKDHTDERKPSGQFEEAGKTPSLHEGTLDTEHVAQSASSLASTAGADDKRKFLGAKPADGAPHKYDELPVTAAESEVMPEHRGVESTQESAAPKPEVSVPSRIFLPTHKPSTQGEAEPDGGVQATKETTAPDKDGEGAPRTFLSTAEVSPSSPGGLKPQAAPVTEATVSPEKQLDEKAERPKEQGKMPVPVDELQHTRRKASVQDESAMKPQAAPVTEATISPEKQLDAKAERREEQGTMLVPVDELHHTTRKVSVKDESTIEPKHVTQAGKPPQLTAVTELADKQVGAKASEKEGIPQDRMIVERQPENEMDSKPSASEAHVPSSEQRQREEKGETPTKKDEKMIIVPRDEFATHARAETSPREVEPVVTRRAVEEVRAAADERKAPTDHIVERIEPKQMKEPAKKRHAYVSRVPVVEQAVVPVRKRPSDEEKRDASATVVTEHHILAREDEPKRSTPVSKEDLHPAASSDWDVMSRESLQGRPGTRTADTQTELSTDFRSKDVREASTYAFLSEETEEARRAPDDYLPLYLHRVTLNDKPSIAEMMRKLTPASEEWEEAVPMNWKINPAKDLEKWPSHCMQDVRTPTIVLLGGINLSALGEVLTGCLVLRYNLEENEWRRCNMMPLPRYGHRCVFLNNEIYVIGGFDNRDATYGLRMSTSFCFRYHTQTGEWNVVAPLRHARGYHNVAVLNNAIYAVGGVDANDLLLSSVERYDREEDTWVVLEKGLYCGRMGMGVAAFQGCLWVVGGIVQIAGLQTCSTAYVEIYNPATDQWTYAANYLPSPRTCVSLLNVNDTELYCFGGIFYNCVGPTRKLLTIDDILVYSDNKKVWRQVACMPAPRHNAHVLQYKNQAYIIGGQDVEKPDHPLSSMIKTPVPTEKFSWGPLKDVPLPISAYAAVVLPPIEEPPESQAS